MGQNTSLNLKRGEAVGVLYRENNQWKVHDGVLNHPIKNGNNPPSSVSIVHYRVYQSGPNIGKLERQDHRLLHNVRQVLRTPSYPVIKLNCPAVSNPDLVLGTPVVAKISVPVSPSLPTGHDAKNGVLVCSLQNRLQPLGRVWINHWQIIDPGLPRLYLETRRYPNAEFVRRVVP